MMAGLAVTCGLKETSCDTSVLSVSLTKKDGARPSLFHTQARRPPASSVNTSIIFGSASSGSG
ncbi:hypothetical protein, partial [Cronobacter sakazakii]|uniref:hypothetical protein n=1 Tax=Cronobacter sakazakii TaxID=28141 RepID=UPI001C614DE1